METKESGTERKEREVMSFLEENPTDVYEALLCELHSSPLLRAAFDAYELNDDLIFDLMKIAIGKE